MSNKQRSFNLDYHIEISGRSRGLEGEETFMEELVKKMMTAFISSLKNKFGGLKLYVNGKEIL